MIKNISYIYNKLIDFDSYVADGVYPAPLYMYESYPDLIDISAAFCWCILFIFILPFRVIYQVVKE